MVRVQKSRLYRSKHADPGKRSAGKSAVWHWYVVASCGVLTMVGAAAATWGAVLARG
jgi:hypothetical protein